MRHLSYGIELVGCVPFPNGSGWNFVFLLKKMVNDSYIGLVYFPKNFTKHRIFRGMHKTLNIDENKK